MTSRKFNLALERRNTGAPPIWLMRQAGRYHTHYRALRDRHGFVDLCKKPELAAEVAMGPIDEFGFDAAILFSDILFPLELLGVEVDFQPGPILSRLLETPADLVHYTPRGSIDALSFQAEALRLTRARLPETTSLIGFIGGPLTLFLFAVQHSRKHGVDEGTRAGLTDGRLDGLLERLTPILIDNMVLQADAGPDVIAVLDSAVDMLTEAEFATLYRPWIARLVEGFHAKRPATPVLYYARGAGPAHWAALDGLPIAGLGVSHPAPLAPVLEGWGRRYAVQGNLDPAVMTLPEAEAARAIEAFLAPIAALPDAARAGWICGLGHGITPEGREANVRRFVELARQVGTVTA